MQNICCALFGLVAWLIVVFGFILGPACEFEPNLKNGLTSADRIALDRIIESIK